MDKEKILKWLLIFSGIFELFLGILFIFFINFYFQSLGIQSLPLYSQLSGLTVFLFGFLLIYSAKDVKTYLIIPITSIILRFIMPIFEIYNAILYPTLGIILIPATLYDIITAALTLILLKFSDYI